jgi:hypothetical protein
MTRIRSRKRSVAGLIAALMIAGLAACGGDDDVGDPAAAETEVTADADTSDAGGAASSDADAGDDGGAGDAAADDEVDFPIPAPDGLVLDALAEAGLDMSGQRQLYYERGDLDRIVAFYDDWTGQNGEWSRGEAQGTVVFQEMSGGPTRSITITPDHDPGAQADGPVTYVLLVAAG